MSLILNINTFSTTAGLSIADNGIVIASVTNPIQKEHAAFLHTAIKELCTKYAIELRTLAAIAVVHGPGSYTGLRVGMATAKGLCYALNLPLITIGSLDLMAHAVINRENIKNAGRRLYCPLIDARRMEVYTAIFDQAMNQILPASNLILDRYSFDEILDTESICFFGNGSVKLREIKSAKNAIFISEQEPVSSLAWLAFEKYKYAQFNDLAYSEPFYLKEFYSSPDNSKK